MPVKRLFQTSGTILLLALAYHVGAHSARAQEQADPVVALAGHGQSHWALTSSGNVYATNWYQPTWTLLGNVLAGTGRGASAFVALEAYGGIIAVTASGDAYWHPASESFGTWTYYGNVFGSVPTSVRHETWGSLKARYRGEHEARK